MDKLTKLPNIGPTLAEKLQEIGITSQHALAELGSIEAVIKIGDQETPALVLR